MTLPGLKEPATCCRTFKYFPLTSIEKIDEVILDDQ